MDPLPTEQVISAVLVQTLELINITVLFPFLIFLVEDFGYSGAEVGIYSGVLAASFCSAQCVSSFWWGWISDKYGRKPAILFGLLGTGIGMIIFGFATTYQQAILGRLVPGLLSGNGGVMKSFLTEITTDSNRAKAFSYLSFGVATGAIVGPLIGGYLSFSSVKYPHIFPSTVFGAYPSLLPATCCLFLTLLTMLYCWLIMTETCPNVIPTGLKKSQGGVRYDVVGNDMSAVTTDHSCSDGVLVMASNADGDIVVGKGVGGGDCELSAVMTGRQVCVHSSDSRQVVCEFHSDEERGGGHSEGEEGGHRDQSFSVFQDQPVLLAASNYGLLCFSFMLMDETIPFLLRSPRQEGGMGMTSSEIGFVLSVSGLPMLLFVLFFLAGVIQGSKLRVFRIFSVGIIVVTALWPAMGVLYRKEFFRIEGGRLLLTTCLIFVATWKHVFRTVCFTSVIVMVNNSVENKHLGMANGFGQSLASAARALGPLFGGIGWSLGLSLGFVYLNFGIIILMFMGNIALSFFLPPSIDTKKKSVSEMADRAATSIPLRSTRK